MAARVRVWDLPTRLIHGLLVASVAAAWVTGDEPRWTAVHAVSGHVAAALVGVRAIWGLWGERWSRWSAFAGAEGPGHTRAAGISAVVALALLLALAGTGAAVWGGEERAGWLAGALTVRQGVWLHELHRILSWGLAGWLGVHLAGVVRQSLKERQSLVLGMIDGRKRWGGAPVRPRTPEAVGLAALLGLGLLGAAVVPPAPPAPLPVEAEWAEACGECHLAYPPELLPARAWTQMFAEQGDHFGEDLMLDEARLGRLAAIAEARSAESGATEAAVRIAGGPAPLRITETPHWKEVHAGISEEVFRSEPVRSAARCGACHGDAESGAFDGTAVRIPEGGQR